MAKKSGAVSHATLHLTVTGHRLQPWETVREFVRACDGDEAEWHARWRETAEALPESGKRSVPDVPEAEGRHPARSRWRLSWALAGAAVALLVVAVANVVTTADGEARNPAEAAGTVETTPAAVSTLPVHEGDASADGDNLDVTYPDGSPVPPGESFTKVWKIHNVGTVAWRDRYLQRIDPLRPDGCVTPERVPIVDTAPGQAVEIAVNVRAPAESGVTCKVRWKMVDESGTVLLPGNDPIFFEVRVTEDA